MTSPPYAHHLIIFARKKLAASVNFWNHFNQPLATDGQQDSIMNSEETRKTKILNEIKSLEELKDSDSVVSFIKIDGEIMRLEDQLLTRDAK